MSNFKIQGGQGHLPPPFPMTLMLALRNEQIPSEPEEHQWIFQ